MKLSFFIWVLSWCNAVAADSCCKQQNHN